MERDRDELKSTDTPYSGFAHDALSRIDETEDAIFYARDRFVSHLDSRALSTVEKIVGQLIIEDHPVILDLMASWDSHIPDTVRAAKVVGLGMNKNELLENGKLSEHVIQDLNKSPSLPFPGATFDVVINTVSIDYLVKPFEVFREVGRVLKPRGLFLVIFSNRMFEDKATKIWRESTERERVRLVLRFFEWTGLFESPRVFVSSGKPRPKEDKYAHLGIPSDPVYAVYAQKTGIESAAPLRPEPEALGDEGEGTPLEAGMLQSKDDMLKRLLCPHCGQRMKKWIVPNHPFSTWDTDFMYLCVNDSCPYLVRGWQTLSRQGNQGLSYRFMYDPIRGSTIPIPIISLDALKEGIAD